MSGPSRRSDPTRVLTGSAVGPGLWAEVGEEHCSYLRVGCGRLCFAESGREQLEGGSRLGLLLSRQVYPVGSQEDPCRCRGLERLVREALRRQLQGARTVRIEPQLGD